MKILKLVMGVFSVLTILLIAKLSIAEPNEPNLEIQPVTYPQQVVSVDNKSYSTVEATVIETQRQ